MKKLVVCNHKMFLTFDEAKELERKIKDINYSNVDLVICPSYINLYLFKDYNLGAQDAFYEDKGPFTGEISAYDLSLIGVKYVIVGHFEKRLSDTDEIINKKIKAVLRNSMIPILCIGETKTDKELNRTSEVIKKQLNKALLGLEQDPYQEIIIAYEPSWVIGGVKSLEKNEIEDTLKYIRKILEQNNIYNYRLLYGGGVNTKNIKDVLSDEVDGYLLGNSSVKVDDLELIIKCIK